MFLPSEIKMFLRHDATMKFNDEQKNLVHERTRFGNRRRDDLPVFLYKKVRSSRLLTQVQPFVVSTFRDFYIVRKL